MKFKSSNILSQECKTFNLGIRLELISKQLLLNASKLDLYCLNRILYKAKLYKIENWVESYDEDWLGELTYYSCAPGLIEDCLDVFKTFSNLSDYEKIEAILINEYGYLSAEVLKNSKNKQVDIVKININDVLPCNNQLKITNAKNIDYYDLGFVNDFPIGIGYYNGSKYKLIDGHHRYTFCLRNGITEVELISIC